MTLIELLLAMTLTVIIMAVIASSLILGLKSTQQVQDQLLDSHDAQLVSVYLPSDLISAQPGALDITPATNTGCAGSPTDPWNVLRLTWSDVDIATTTWYRVAYRVVQNGADWRLARFSCQAGTEVGLSSATATMKLLLRNLQNPSLGLPSLVEDQERMKLRITDASGYAFTIAASRRLITIPNAPATARARPVEISDVSMFDSDTNGRVDRVTVTFTGTLPAPCRSNGFFALDAVPSAGSLASVDFGAASSTSTTLALTEGTGAADTGIGEFRVRFTPTTGCDALAYDGPPVHDQAAPVVVSFAAGPLGATNPLPGKAEQGDTFSIGFSEAVTGVSPTGTLSLSATTLTIGTISGAPMTVAGYYLGSNSATFPFTSALDATTGQYVVTLGACTSRCTNLQQSPGGPTTFAPASTIKDAALNSATVLGASPVPTDLAFRAF